MALTAPSYNDDRGDCQQFLHEFQSSATATMDMTYVDQLQEIVNRQRSTLTISLDDLEDSNPDLARKVLRNTNRYVKLFADAADAIAKDMAPTVAGTDRSVLDVYIEHRSLLRERQSEDENNTSSAVYPNELLRRYQVVFIPPDKLKRSSIRQVEAKHIGTLVKVEGIVTRATAVKPMMRVATYTCDACSSEIYQEVAGPSFMPLFTCKSEFCAREKRKGRLHLQVRGSKFEKFQEIKIQEMANDVPTGHIPRSMTVYARGEVTRACAPGDQVTVTGTFLPVPYTGYRAIRAGLLSDTFVEAMQIVKAKETYVEHVITDEMRDEIEEYANDSEVYDKLANSIAPEIWGHDDVKKALLLLLVGGVDRKMNDGMKIRGDINVLLMGDPGVAKSQLLKKVADLAPRGVYTTGRGSSGVGLTAAITRDPITNEIILEGGALVLADMGVCCIDEFDKMEEGDRTAIHEVMEQQTISIAKAGITTTLNARSAILAAANPLYGRYNVKRSPTQNINLPDALRSRFDLVFLLLDRPDEEADLKLANHITYVHSHNTYPVLEFQPLEKEFIRNYVAMAKKYQPYISPDLAENIAARYAKMREEAQADPNQGHMTARTLLAMLRLASSLARLRFSNSVAMDDFEEAVRLMDASVGAVREAQAERRDVQNPMSAIYGMIRAYAKREGLSEIRIEDIRQRVVTSGFNDAQLSDCLTEYESLDVWMIDDARTTITFSH